LVIGIADDRKSSGLSAGDFLNEDKVALHLMSLFNDRVGEILLAMFARILWPAALPYGKVDA
jgi:hypothetical protein